MKISEAHIEYALQLLGRIAIPEEKVRKAIVGQAKRKQGAQKNLRAFNLADGTLTAGEIAKKAGIDPGNFSRLADRWIKSGIMHAESSGKQLKLRHIYPIDFNASGK